LAEQGEEADKNSSAAESKTDWQDIAKQNPRVPEMNKSLAEATGNIESRADVEKSLKLINGYYAQYEPSSPIPVLVNRALKLVNKDFMQIMQNLYPDAVPALRQLGGIEDDEGENADEAKTDDAW
jgi:type VI secretion system protein ImpA